MKFSVIIPAYNAGATIEATLNSVLNQTLSPYEILVCDDGSVDNTAGIINRYKYKVQLFRQTNHGVAYTQNFLCEKARGDIVALLAHDDIWHPKYLEVQNHIIKDNPDGIAYFTEHVNFYGFGSYQWSTDNIDINIYAEKIEPLDFLKIYNKTPMSFQWSCGCISKNMLNKIGKDPFRISGAEDTYIHNMLPLFGSILYIPVPLVAYRITNTSLGSRLLENSILITKAFDLLENKYKECANPKLYRQFRKAFASRIRQCGKFLMGARRVHEAQDQFRLSFTKSFDPISMAKSLFLLSITCLPVFLQPKWPHSQRVT